MLEKTLLLILFNVRLSFSYHYLRSLAFVYRLLSILFICCTHSLPLSIFPFCVLMDTLKIAKWRDMCVVLCCVHVWCCYCSFFPRLFSFVTYTGSFRNRNGTIFINVWDINIKRLRWRRWRKTREHTCMWWKAIKEYVFLLRSNFIFVFIFFRFVRGSLSPLRFCCYFVRFNSLLTGTRFFPISVLCVFLFVLISWPFYFCDAIVCDAT